MQGSENAHTRTSPRLPLAHAGRTGAVGACRAPGPRLRARAGGGLTGLVGPTCPGAPGPNARPLRPCTAPLPGPRHPRPPRPPPPRRHAPPYTMLTPPRAPPRGPPLARPGPRPAPRAGPGPYPPRRCPCLRAAASRRRAVHVRRAGADGGLSGPAENGAHGPGDSIASGFLDLPGLRPVRPVLPHGVLVRWSATAGGCSWWWFLARWPLAHPPCPSRAVVHADG